MKVNDLIEKHFWIYLSAGMIFGIVLPIRTSIPHFLPKLILGMMLFTTFLKIDALEIVEKIKDIRFMLITTSVYMIIVPLLFFFTFRIFDRELALGILLLTAMPSAVSSPSLTDILKGNIPLAMSIVLVTQLIAPFTVPFLFWLIDLKGMQLNELLMLRDMAILVFVPMIISQLVKRYFPMVIARNQHFLTSTNILLLSAFVYIAVSSQRDHIIGNPGGLVWKTAVLFLVFFILHIIGYYLFRKKSKADRISLAVTSAYMNNGLAIVLAATYFSPAILILMVLSEVPWNTLLAPFKKIIS